MTAARLVRVLGLSLVIGLPLSQVLIYAVAFEPADLESYLWAGEAWRTTGNPYAQAPMIIDGNPIYRYAPWFAVPWIWLSTLPTDLVEVGWAAVMTVSAVLAVIPLFQAHGARALPVGAFLLGWLVAAGLNGNVQPAVVALLAWGVPRSWGPGAIAVTASLKAVPILFALVYVGRGEWGRAVWTAALTVPLVAPMLLFDIPAVNTSAGQSYSLYATSPILWGAVAAGCAIISLVLARTRYAWLAAGTTVLMALPRAFVYDLTFMLPGLSERATASSRKPAGASVSP